MTLNRYLLLTFALAATLVGQTPPLQFSDVTTQCGINWVHLEPGPMMGVGGAWLDYDSDGWPDLLLVGGVTPPALYRNVGGNFVDVSASSNLAPPVAGEAHMGAAVNDYDNDGDPDIYVLAEGANILYRNEGGGLFTDVTASAGIGDPSWTTGAAFADFDGDGFDDLYVGNYVAVVNFPYHTPYANRLYRNNGDGTFSDITAVTATGGAGCTLAVSWTDFDDDGDADIMVGNDFGAWVQPNQLYRNDGPAAGPPGSWTFSEVSVALGADVAVYCMGITAGDIDRDLDKDYYYSNLGRNVLLRNDGAAGFTDVTTATGTENTFDLTTSGPQLFATSWGVGFHDFDLDGWVDLYVSNGHIPAAPFIANGLNTPSALYHHDGQSVTFTEMAAAAGVSHVGVGRGCFFADYDRDGDVDILQANIQAAATLYRNDCPVQGNFTRLRPRGRITARDGQGTNVRVDVRGFSLIREVNRNYSFESASELDLNFGLGGETVAERISARWPSGITHQLHDVHVGGAAFELVEPVVTVGWATNGPTSLQEGQTGTFVLELVNHTGVAQSVFHKRTVTAIGQTLLDGVVEIAVVPAFGSIQIPWTVTLPVGATGGAAFDASLYWTVADAGGGFDEWKNDVTLAP